MLVTGLLLGLQNTDEVSTLEATSHRLNVTLPKASLPEINLWSRGDSALPDRPRRMTSCPCRALYVPTRDPIPAVFSEASRYKLEIHELKSFCEGTRHMQLVMRCQ